MSSETIQAYKWDSAFDSLRRLSPQMSHDLASQFPEFENEILGKRIFGTKKTVDDQRAALSRASAEAVLGALTQSLDEVLSVARRRAHFLAKIRMGSGITAMLGSGTVIAALLQSAKQTGTVSALIAASATMLNLLMTYYEDQSGGDGSVARIRDTLIEQIGDLAEIRGNLTNGVATQDDQAMITIMTKLTAISAKLQVLRARLGLSIGVPTTN
jgi:hypothetical protein